MLWFFVLIFLTFDGLETSHLEGPYANESDCLLAIRHAGSTIPEWVQRATATPCTPTRVRTATLKETPHAETRPD